MLKRFDGNFPYDMPAISIAFILRQPDFTPA